MVDLYVSNNNPYGMASYTFAHESLHEIMSIMEILQFLSVA